MNEESFEEKVINNLLPLYEQMDSHACEIVKKHEELGQAASCKRGCNHCCYQLTNVLLAEGITIADTLFKKKNWMAIAKDLKAAAKKCHGPNLTRAFYLEQQNRCPLLDVEHGECTIYNVRPSACRYLYVISPADDCSVKNNGKNVLALNMTKLETTVWEFSSIISKGHLIASPLPIMVLYSMLAAAKSNKAKRYLKRLCMGVPDPIRWIKELMNNDKIFTEEAPQHQEAILESMKEVKGTFTLE